jgi:hypothetical protein
MCSRWPYDQFLDATLTVVDSHTARQHGLLDGVCWVRELFDSAPGVVERNVVRKVERSRLRWVFLLTCGPCPSSEFSTRRPFHNIYGRKKLISHYRMIYRASINLLGALHAVLEHKKKDEKRALSQRMSDLL